jgi:hypothetical protein
MGIASEEIIGTIERRCTRIVIEKPKTGTASALFLEQQLITIDGEQIEKSLPGIFKQYDPAESFDILDGAGNPTGKKATYGDVFALIRSAYMCAAKVRDEQVAHAAETIHSQKGPDHA